MFWHWPDSRLNQQMRNVFPICRTLLLVWKVPEVQTQLSKMTGYDVPYLWFGNTNYRGFFVVVCLCSYNSLFWRPSKLNSWAVIWLALLDKWGVLALPFLRSVKLRYLLFSCSLCLMMKRWLSLHAAVTIGVPGICIFLYVILIPSYLYKSVYK